MRKIGLEQFAVGKALALIALGPALGLVLDDGIELARLEGFELGGLVLVQAIDHPVEVEGTAPHRQVLAPIRRVALEGDAAPGIVALDQVGPAGHRILEGQLVERYRGGPFLREHRQGADNQRQLDIALLEIEPHRARVHHRDGLHIRAHAAVAGAGCLAHQHVVGVLDVAGQHRIAVAEARLRPDVEGNGQFVRRHGHVFRQQAIGAGGFIAAGNQQRLEHQRVHARGGGTLERERIELVEAGAAVRVRERQRAAARRVRVGVVEMGEVGGILEAAVLCEAMGGSG